MSPPAFSSAPDRPSSGFSGWRAIKSRGASGSVPRFQPERLQTSAKRAGGAACATSMFNENVRLRPQLTPADRRAQASVLYGVRRMLPAGPRPSWRVSSRDSRAGGPPTAADRVAAPPGRGPQSDASSAPDCAGRTGLITHLGTSPVCPAKVRAALWQALNNSWALCLSLAGPVTGGCVRRSYGCSMLR